MVLGLGRPVALANFTIPGCDIEDSVSPINLDT
jgi:queuine/archaeosine tRNA-ribosyltransferase